MPKVPAAGASAERLRNMPSLRLEMVATPAHDPFARAKSAVITSETSDVRVLCIDAQADMAGMSNKGSNLRIENSCWTERTR